MSSIFSNLVNKFKTKKTLNNLEINDEYAFSLEELETMEEENHKKIKDLKKNVINLKYGNKIFIVDYFTFSLFIMFVKRR